MQSISISPANPVGNTVAPVASTSNAIIGILSVLSSFLIIAGFVIGIIYIIKSKKSKGKRILIGIVIIVVPFIINFILNIVKYRMILSMY